MYLSVIGRRLVECFNQREGTTYGVQEFFDEIYIPLFFGSSRFMQYVNNSPFDQAITKQKRALTEALKSECLAAIHSKVDDQAPDGSFFIGGPAAGATETTSGQVTSMEIPVTNDDVYASWIGAAVGLTVEGGFTIVVDSGDVLLATYDGWSEYRRLLDQTPGLKPLQINAWNGQWVTNQMSRPTPFRPVFDKDAKALETQSWVRLLFALSYHFREGPSRKLLAYVYSLGQMNKTIGFVRLNLPEVRRLADLFHHLFTVPEGMPPGRFEEFYEAGSSFSSACQATEVGLRALKPTDVFQAEKDIPKAPSKTDAKRQLAFDTYQTWIIAMLNNKELLVRAEEIAESLNRFRRDDDRGKMVRKQLVEDLLRTKNRRDFIGALTVILEQEPAAIELFERTVSDILALSVDNVPLFLTLIRFKYAVVAARK